MQEPSVGHLHRGWFAETKQMSNLDLESPRSATPAPIPNAPQVRSRSWMLSISLGVVALAALIGGSTFGDRKCSGGLSTC